MHSYHSDTINEFLKKDPHPLCKILKGKSKMPATREQTMAWEGQLEIMMKQLELLEQSHGLGGRVYLEFSIPRMGKRADAVVVCGGIIFILEFKVGKQSYEPADMEQCTDYALDLKNFHEASHTRPILPILVATGAMPADHKLEQYDDGVFQIIYSNGSDLAEIIHKAIQKCPDLDPLDIPEWEESGYKPTPTIIEAARALYNRHNVEDITRSEAGAENLSKTTASLEAIMRDSRKGKRKSYLFTSCLEN